MQLQWVVSDTDAAVVRDFVRHHETNQLVQFRKKFNLAEQKKTASRNAFWRALVGSLLTTQQRSGPDSAVSRFINTRPHPIDYAVAQQQPKLPAFIQKTLSEFGGIRFSKKLASELSENYLTLENGAWPEVLRRVNSLTTSVGPRPEREVAEYLDDTFKGLGPKQSRNLLQGLGLTQYEIPIDSRITKWLNNFGFPFHLSATALADRNYYDVVSEGIQHLCKAAGVMPCIFDAAVFASYDKATWSENIAAW